MNEKDKMQAKYTPRPPFSQRLDKPNKSAIRTVVEVNKIAVILILLLNNHINKNTVNADIAK